jgi:hypothetical protein
VTAEPVAGTQRVHSEEDRCFYCATTDADIARTDNGWEGRTVHMDLAADQCPFWAPDDEETP